ncbi:VacJ family lipoprotein [Uliginosibacterium sediminicola]|uniref:VacJ family lipoprotein n=1 Tax=Uliginosibacterium sediminicola TaxID=2024550 RepID=A0ABU9YZ46_9RHOO
MLSCLSKMIAEGRRAGVWFACGVSLLLAACATGSNPRDPWEDANRKVLVFNQKVDAWVLKPVAQGYDAVAPTPVRIGVSNVFSNVEDVWIGINNLLQGKPAASANDFGRFAINLTLGIFGVFDVASEMGLDKHDEDFGQTLGVWGVKDGPFVMLPFFGPRTLRDSGALVVDTLANPLSYIPAIPVRNVSRGLKLISERADLLSAEKALDDAALDYYSYLRDFYLNRRKSQIRDGRRVRDEDEQSRAEQPTVIVFNAQDKDVELGRSRLLFVELERKVLAAGVLQQSELASDVPAPTTEAI